MFGWRTQKTVSCCYINRGMKFLLTPLLSVVVVVVDAFESLLLLFLFKKHGYICSDGSWIGFVVFFSLFIYFFLMVGIWFHCKYQYLYKIGD